MRLQILLIVTLIPVAILCFGSMVEAEVVITMPPPQPASVNETTVDAAASSQPQLDTGDLALARYSRARQEPRSFTSVYHSPYFGHYRSYGYPYACGFPIGAGFGLFNGGFFFGGISISVNCGVDKGLLRSSR